MTERRSIVPAERIERGILLIRGETVMLDRELATLYGVPTKALNQAVRRNRDRFPSDFMFQSTWAETRDLRSQSVTLNDAPDASDSGSQSVTLKRGENPKYRPLAFTEHGVAMLSSVLRSRRAVRVNIEIMRAFVRVRQMLASHADLVRRLDALERKYDGHFRAVFEAIRRLMQTPAREVPRIGFHTRG